MISFIGCDPTVDSPVCWASPAWQFQICWADAVPQAKLHAANVMSAAMRAALEVALRFGRFN
jgi:hypothetical protein